MLANFLCYLNENEYFCIAMNMGFAQALVQLKAFARQDGLIVLLLWVASFAATILMPQMPWGNLLALATPFVVYWRLAGFRDYALGGSISFWRAFAYSWYTLFYASLLFCIVQYVYFRFLDNGRFFDIMNSGLRMLEPIYKEQGLSVQELKDSMSLLQTLKPIQLAFVVLTQNIFIAVLLSLPIALIGRRKKNG
jgi:hypothetical protein